MVFDKDLWLSSFIALASDESCTTSIAIKLVRNLHVLLVAYELLHNIRMFGIQFLPLASYSTLNN